MDVVDRPVLGGDPERPVGPHERLGVEHEAVLDGPRQVLGPKDPLREQLVPVEVDRSPTDLAPDDLEAVLRAVRQVHLAVPVLVPADAHVGCVGRDEQDRIGRVVAHRVPDGVVDRLGADRRNGPQVEQSDRVHGRHLNPRSGSS